MYSVTQRYYYSLAFLLIVVSPLVGQETTTRKFTLNPITSRVGAMKSCTTKNNATGLCVHKSSCNDYHEIETGGRIAENELRASSECNVLQGEWCCSEKNITKKPVNGNGATISPAPPAKKDRKCVALEGNDCPWFVMLYRTGQDYPYCAGAVIGTQTILTTATCVVQANDRFLWARVPGSLNPGTNYTVLSRFKHPKYNSGNRLNDMALLTTLSHISWDTGLRKGACIDPQQSLGGECIAANINEYDDLEMVSTAVTKGSCDARGSASDAMCGTGSADKPLVDGAPIACSKNNVLLLSGITKTSYSSDSKVLLGNFDYSWLINTLKNEIKLSDEDFLFNFNY